MASNSARRIQEPVRRGQQPLEGTDCAPIVDGVILSSTRRGVQPRACAKCGSPDLKAHFHRDMIACLTTRFCIHKSGEHLHWCCKSCGYDFTTPCLSDVHSQD